MSSVVSSVASEVTEAGSGVTVALSLSLDLALAARMRVLKTCWLVGSRMM